MKINKINYISNNYTTPNRANKVLFGNTVPMNNDSFEKTKTTSQDNKTVFGKIAGGLAAFGSLAGIGVAAKKGKLGNLYQKLKPFKLQHEDTTWSVNLFGASTLNEANKVDFLRRFVEPIKKGKQPQNGFLVQGPESKGKEEFFNWGIEQLKDAGVEIIDATDKDLGHSTKKHIGKLWNLFQPEVEEDFKKNKKYKLFVLRKLEKIDPEHNHAKVSNCLKGDTAKSAQEYGVMLAYDCLDSSHFDPAITRMERIDGFYTPQPNADESLDVWKKYVHFAKHKYPSLTAKKAMEETREIMAKRGDKDLKEMEPLIKYNVPYEVPKLKNKEKDWKRFFDATKNELEDFQIYRSYAKAARVLVSGHLYHKISDKKYNNIMGMLKENTPDKYKERMNNWIRIELNQRV